LICNYIEAISKLKTSSRQYRRFFRSAIITFGIAALIILGLHLWFVHNAKRMIIDIVAKESKGKLKMELSEFSFDFFSDKIQVKKASLVSTDTATAAVTYAVTFKKLTLKSTSFFSALFGKKISFDSIKLHEPDIVITQWRKDTVTRRTGDDLSISQEMGRLYNSMLDGIDAFEIRRLWIRDAKISLVNKMKPEELPVTVSNINFNLFRTANAARKRDEYLPNEQTVDLDVTNQEISLPGGRHKIAFKTFSLQLFRKRMQLDSCTITAIAKDSTKSSYQVYFKQLLLVGVDFDKMYRYNLIKADSVYCQSPLFQVNINTRNTASAAGNTKNNERPDAEKIVQELTGDLDLAYVGVKDAGIHININGRKNRSLYNSHQDDFEMFGLSINSDSAKPVTVKRFDMLVRDYHLYDKDSATTYSFDSIHFLNNKIVLNNFTAISSGKGKSGSKRDFRIPYFELTGLDWYELVFNETMVAREAVLVNPVINYSRSAGKKQKKKGNLFRSLQTLDDLIALNKISVMNGQINMKLGSTTDLRISDADLILYSDRLLSSTNNEGLRRAVERLSFSKANVRFGDIKAELINARYTGTNLLHADQILVSGKDNKINARLQNVDMNNLLVDDDNKKIIIKGLKWGSGEIAVRSDKNAANTSKGDFYLENLQGNNTKFQFINGETTVRTFVKSISLAQFSKDKNANISLNGLDLQGTALNFKGKDMTVSAGSYDISSENNSTLSNVRFRQLKERDTISVDAPQVNFFMDVNSIFAKDMHFENLGLVRPVVRFYKWNQDKPANAKPAKLRIDNISMTEPDIVAVFHKEDSVSSINIPFSAGSHMKIKGLSLNEAGLAISNFTLNTKSATLRKMNGDLVGVEKGMVDLDVSNISLASSDGKPNWSAWVRSIRLENPEQFYLGKNRNVLKVGNTTIGNVNLSSDYINNFSRLLKFNISAWLKTSTGSYADSSISLKWYNAEFNADKKILALDSFSYRPSRSLDSVMAQSPFQTDYITLSTGRIQMSEFNLDKYEKDSSIIANTMQIDDPVITIYRDKKPPFQSGRLKPLPVDMIRMIGLPVQVEKIRFSNGHLSYTEKHPKSRAEGTVVLTHMNATLGNIKNRNITDEDSLTLTMNSYLMDSTFLSLTVKESYADSLSGFLMTLKMKPTTLSFLNPILVPLSNVRITSGKIDSFEVRAIGKEDLAIGEMRMFYHDLRIRLLKNGEEQKSGLAKSFVTFLANLVIKKNNDGRTGIIYFERLKDRSFFNYIVKMTFSGMATSIGVVKNRKYLKKYKKELKARNLPPIELY
jgi:hypothetical protein